MPQPPGRIRRQAGPWIVIQVPNIDDDPLYPSSRRFYAKDEPTSSTEFIDKAQQFTVRKEAESVANKLMHYSRNTWAEVVPFSMAWALVHAGGAPWNPRQKP